MISIDDFYRQLLEIASGWLGWTQEQALKTDVNYIMIAHEGRMGMLKAIFGSSEDRPKKQPKGPSANEIRNYVRTHNALMKKGRIRKH